MPMPRADRRRAVVVLVFDGVRLLDVTGPLEVFDVARSMGAPYDVTVCSPDGTDVTTSGGLRLGVTSRARSVGPVDTLVVPGGEVLVEVGPPAGLPVAIRQLATGARRVTSICTGSFALG
ncbi:MAG TPA: DJ-1/PfpI family protein, partial [Pseudonocardia sp.]